MIGGFMAAATVETVVPQHPAQMPAWWLTSQFLTPDNLV